jgi:hypothetical protein
MARITDDTPVRLTATGPDLIRSTIEDGPHSQRWWAETTGISQGTISNIINRRLRRLTYGTAKTLADALNLHFGDVFEVLDQPPRRRSMPRPTRRKRRTDAQQAPEPDGGDTQK